MSTGKAADAVELEANRAGEAQVVHVSEMTPGELSRKADELEALSRGAALHADELRRLASKRDAA